MITPVKQELSIAAVLHFVTPFNYFTAAYLLLENAVIAMTV